MSNYGSVYGGMPSAANYNYTYTPHLSTPETFGSFVKPSRDRSSRKRMSIYSIFVSWLVPVFLFTLLFTLMSSKMRFDMPWLCVSVSLIELGAIAAFGIPAINAIRTKSGEPTWLIFLFVTCLIAWLLASIAGQWNFTSNMEPFYRISSLNMYPAVDPALVQGRELMDAGRVIFTEDTHLDTSKSIGYRRSKMYCVAPITSSAHGNITLASYDLWAVGTDCCQPGIPGFRCDPVSDLRVHAGMRLMRDEDRELYRLAVQQAEAAYNIKAEAPLFFTWMLDPVGGTDALETEGHSFNYRGVVAFVVMQGIVVVCAAISYAKSHY